MARLPTPGSDTGNWGNLLNEYLQVGHRTNGAHKFVINVKEFGARGDGTTHDQVPIQAAIDEAGQLGGGLVYFPPGTYVIDSSLQLGRVSENRLLGYSNISIRGAGIGATVIKCTSSLNGSDHISKNNVFNANNVAGPNPYTDSKYVENIWIFDMTIDCTAQNASGIPAGQRFGGNLCAIEYQNVHKAGAVRIRVIKACGNAIVSGSIDPTPAGAVYGAWIEDCVFDNCVTAPLPQYDNIAGSVVQYGAMKAGVIKGCLFMNSGGPAIDFFNCQGTIVEGNYFQNGERKGSNPTQTVNSIHSDFGLVDCIIRNNVMEFAGPIMLSGLMKPLYGLNTISQTADRGVPGPNGCIISGNIVRPLAANKGSSNINAIWMLTGNVSGYPTGVAANNIIIGNVIYDGAAGINVNDCTNTLIDSNQLI